MKKIMLATLLSLTSVGALAAHNSALSVPSYFGSINNNSGYVIECSQVVGGYCANNPMPDNGYIQMLPDPGAKEIRGHIMAFDKNKPGHYIDNLLFIYSQQKNKSWGFKITSLDNTIHVKYLQPDTVVLTRASKK